MASKYELIRSNYCSEYSSLGVAHVNPFLTYINIKAIGYTRTARLNVNDKVYTANLYTYGIYWLLKSTWCSQSNVL